MQAISFLRKTLQNLLIDVLLPGNKFEKESGELFSIYSHCTLEGYSEDYFFHEYKIKNTKKNLYTTQKIKVVTFLNFDIFFYILRDLNQTWSVY
jgi:hypothetical protein